MSIVETTSKSGSIPELPHVEVNQIQLSVVIRNLCVYTITELKEFFKLNQPNQRLNMLKLVVYLRNQFLRLYVLIKWVKTIKNNNFHLLIDLLNYLRVKNMNVGQVIWNLKNIVINSTLNAKLPKPDLETSLQVFTLGAPQIEDETDVMRKLNKLKDKYASSQTLIPNDMIIQKLDDLDVYLSMKIAMANVPESFKSGTKYIKNGKWAVEIEGEYEIIFTVTSDSSPFCLVDIKFLLSSNSLDLSKHQTNKILNQHINTILSGDKAKCLYEVENLLSKKVLFLRIFLCKQILANHNQSKGQFETPLKIVYNESSITINYWVASNLVSSNQDHSIVVNIKEYSEVDNKLKLVLKWNLDIPVNIKKYLNIQTEYSDDLFENIIQYISEIINNHIKLIKHTLFTNGKSMFTGTENNLTFEIPITPTKNSVLEIEIDRKTGKYYFKDTDNFLNSSKLLIAQAKQINQQYLYPNEVLSAIQSFKIKNSLIVLQNMFLKTGWCVFQDSQIMLNESEINPKSKKSFIRMKNWPLHWYLVVSTRINSANDIIVYVQIAKLIRENMNWTIKHLSEFLEFDEDSSMNSISMTDITYKKIFKLQNTILAKIISHSILDIFLQLKLNAKQISTTGSGIKFLPSYILDNMKLQNIDVNSLSLFCIKAEDFMAEDRHMNVIKPVLFIAIDSANNITLYGSFDDKFETSSIIGCNPRDLRITFLGQKAFYMKTDEKNTSENKVSETEDESLTSLNRMKDIIAKYKSDLKHLIVLTSTITRLTSIFPSNNFSIIKVNVDEILFNYLPKNKHNSDMVEYDCKIDLKNTKSLTEMKFELSSKNPQRILDDFFVFANKNAMSQKVLFEYYQNTSHLFAAIEQIKNYYDNENQNANNINFKLFVHSLTEFELGFYTIGDDQTYEGIGIKLDLRVVSRGHDTPALIYEIKTRSIDVNKNLKKITENNIKNSKFEVINDRLHKECFVANHSDPNNKFTPIQKKSKLLLQLGNHIVCSTDDVYDIIIYIHNVFHN